MHNKFSILGRHRIYRTCAAACPGAAHPCFWDSPTSRHMHKEKAPLATSWITQIKPPNASSNTKNPPPLPAVRTHLDTMHTHLHTYTQTHTCTTSLGQSTSPYWYITKIRLNHFFQIKLLLFLWELSKKNQGFLQMADDVWYKHRVSTKIFQSLQQFSRESHRDEPSASLRTTTEHNLKNMPGKQLYRNKKPKWSQVSSRIDPKSE